MTLYKIERLLSAGRGKKLYVNNTTGPSSYSSGGFSHGTGLSSIDAAVVVASGGYLAEYDTANAKIKVYQFNYPATAAGTATEVSAGTDLSGVTFFVIAVGE